MREHGHSAALRRDQRLAQVRNLTLWIGGGAAAASLALGTVFAHSIPGHASTTTTRSSSGATGGQPSAGTPGQTGATHHSGTGRPATRHHRQHHRLSPPASAPTSKPAPAPPPVVSGGS